MSKSQTKAISSKDGETKHFWVPTICQFYIDAFHMVFHSIFTINMSWKLFSTLDTQGEKKPNVAKTGKTLNKFKLPCRYGYGYESWPTEATCATSRPGP